MTECFICAKHASGNAFGLGAVYEDDVVYASHGGVPDGERAYLGYLFVEPRRHVARLGDLSVAEAAAVGVLVNDLARVLRASEGAEHVYSRVYGDGVPHLHVHLQPRYPDTPKEFWPRRVDGAIEIALPNWPGAPRGDIDAVRALSGRLRQAVAELRADR